MLKIHKNLSLYTTVLQSIWNSHEFQNVPLSFCGHLCTIDVRNQIELNSFYIPFEYTFVSGADWNKSKHPRFRKILPCFWSFTANGIDPVRSFKEYGSQKTIFKLLLTIMAQEHGSPMQNVAVTTTLDDQK